MLKIPKAMSRINSIAVLECKEKTSASAGTYLEGSHGKMPARAKRPSWLKLKGSLITA